MFFQSAITSLLAVLLFLPSLYAQETDLPSPIVLTLDGAIERAVQYNHGLLAARYGLREAEAGVTVARAGFLPRISLQGSYTRLAELPAIEMATPLYGTLQLPVFDTLGNTMGYTEVPGIVGADTMAFQMGSEENYLARTSLQQPLFTWGKILNGYQIANLNLSAVREEYRRMENDLVLDVTRAFYGILVLQELAELMERARDQTARHVETVERRYEAGLESRFDLLRARVQLANTEPQVIKSRNDLEIALNGFKTLLGFSREADLTLDGRLEYEPVEVDLAQSLEEARTNRPEIRSISLRRSMAGKALSIAKKANWPDLALVANYDYKKPLHFEDEWGSDWSVSLAVQMSLFTGFENLGKMKQARARLRQAEHGLRLTEEGVELEVASAYLRLQESKKIVESQQGNVTQAEETLKIAEERYSRGLATSLEVMDTQLAFTQARMNYLRAISDYIIARADIQRATGR